MLQKAAGGSQVANVGMGNIFSALQTGAMAGMYGGGGSGSSSSAYPSDYIQGVNTSMLRQYPTPRTTTPRIPR